MLHKCVARFVSDSWVSCVTFTTRPQCVACMYWLLTVVWRSRRLVRQAPRLWHPSNSRSYRRTSSNQRSTWSRAQYELLPTSTHHRHTVSTQAAMPTLMYQPTAKLVAYGNTVKKYSELSVRHPVKKHARNRQHP